jgi:AraC family transcriptional regulator, regulatory protein of adaptative response / methylated-DNA-[protein]-cysteine methyltransferase
MPLTQQNPRDHYALIARALMISDQAETPLSLEGLAAQLDLSASHFQRLFSQWVGVSPKRYQQYLTLDLARRLLANRFTTLESSHLAGLSGGGRLHDLFLTWEAMSPGEYAAAGAGRVIEWGQFASPFGHAIVMATDRGICGLAFYEEIGFEASMKDMRARWPKALYHEKASSLTPLVVKLFDNKPTRLHVIGAPFQIKVWEALLNIPSGQVTSYSEIARQIDHPKAVRAVGTAVGRNPISWLIPCHRAMRKSGGLGGYHWGLPVKRAMLAYEAARRDMID